ncbi:hypothetical protein [Trichormus azollae]|uniref:hypothetical protein n=1 Tax=Trichormus azollae TaxID=1164 RepID=UPI0002FA913B|nr:hypothetical protein [Trichormus azollae]
METSDLAVIRITIAGAGPNGVEIACKLVDRLKTRGEIRLIDKDLQPSIKVVKMHHIGLY